jgi:hypothetical protein
MKANVAININPFQVPYSVTAQAFTPPVPVMPDPMWVKGAPQPAPAYPIPPSAPPGPFTVPLSELDPATLEQLCDDFRTRVFELAGKQRPDGVQRYVPRDEMRAITKWFIEFVSSDDIAESVNAVESFVRSF